MVWNWLGNSKYVGTVSGYNCYDCFPQAAGHSYGRAVAAGFVPMQLSIQREQDVSPNCVTVWAYYLPQEQPSSTYTC
jgi:hypothetical protein